MVRPRAELDRYPDREDFPADCPACEARETLGATRREKSAQCAKPTAETSSPRAGYGDVALFLTLGNHVGLRGLPGGAEGIQTDGLA
jgi:hypothetical protein